MMKSSIVDFWGHSFAIYQADSITPSEVVTGPSTQHPARTVTQGPGDCTRLASPRISAKRSPFAWAFPTLPGPKRTISYLRRRLGDIPKNTACTASSDQHPFLGLGTPGSRSALLSNTDTPHSLLITRLCCTGHRRPLTKSLDESRSQPDL